MDTPFQQLGDRTAHSKRRLDAVQLDGEGVRLLRTFASATACRASTDHVDGTFCAVKGIGIFQFDAASNLSDTTYTVLLPADVAGVGRWVLVTNSAINQPNGTLGVDPGGKAQPSLVYNGLVAMYRKTTAVASAGASATTVLATQSVPVVAGDIVEVTGSQNSVHASGTYFAVSTSGGLLSPTTDRAFGDGGALAFATSFVATGSGNATVSFSVVNGSGGAVAVTATDFLALIKVFRP